MKTLYWIIGAFALCVAILFVMGSSSVNLAVPLELNKINPQDHVQGNASSTVILIEYADFQCPSCKSYYPIVRQIVETYGKDIAIVYRYFPLSSIHMNADFSARAAEAAGKQGEDKWWKMHDLLFEKQDEWATDADYMKNFSSYAELIGLDIAKFKTDFDSKQVKDFVKAEKSYAGKIGLQGTPTFYLKGEKIDNPPSFEAFKLLINKALSK
jgi:protein-disulfide isomerase